MTFQGVSRIQPVGLPSQYKTYQILAPKATHSVAATCAEVDCMAHAHGWVTAVDVATELGKRQAEYIRSGSGRRFTEERDPTGQLVSFTFAPGQVCFGAAEHRRPLERDPLYLVRGGDWRDLQALPDALRHRTPDDFVDDFANHQQSVADAVEKG